MVLFLHGGSPFKVSQPDSTESGWTAAQLSTMGGTSSKSEFLYVPFVCIEPVQRLKNVCLSVIILANKHVEGGRREFCVLDGAELVDADFSNLHSDLAFQNPLGSSFSLKSSSLALNHETASN
jgi:hypothetical protein